MKKKWKAFIVVIMIACMTLVGCTEASKVSSNVSQEAGNYIIGLNENTMYVIEDLGGAKINKYKYEVNYIPESIIPFTVTEKE